jgi:2,5-furandicarboxylate decarboxylase 1
MRAWLRHLFETGRAVEARPKVALTHELAAIAKRLDGEKAVLFPEPDGHAVPVTSGLVARRSWIAEAIGVAEEGLLERFRVASENPIPWAEVEDATVQSEVHRQVDLGALLPLPTHAEHDSGPYISAGLLISRNPKTGVQNVSINRAQLSAPNRLGVLLLPRHANRYYEAAEAEDQVLPVAIVIGVDPLTLLASQAIVPIDHDELEIAGALHGEPLKVVKCLTSDVRVPANAEIIIEGRLLPHVREPEGPFGEFPKYYGPRTDKPVIEVNAVTTRRRPIFHTILGGGLEHLLLGSIPREATLLAHLKRSFPSVQNLHLSLGGVGRYHLYVQLSGYQPGEPKNVIAAAFGAHYDVKHVTVVDADVNIHDPEEVEWAVATRFQADRDLVVIEGAQGSKLDPSTADGVGAKMGLDATIAPGSDPFRYERTRIPGESAVDLDRDIGQGGDVPALLAD